MARRLSTVADMVSEIREQLSEFNTDSVDTQSKILPTMNRGLDYAWDLLARRYADQVTTSAPLIADGTANSYDIPEDCFEDRVFRAEVQVGSGSKATYQAVTRIAPSDVWQVESSSPTSIPRYYSIQGREIRFYPASDGTYNFRLWYVREAESLVMPQGRITAVNQAGNYLYVDSPGTDLSTESDSLASYVNLVDAQTGAVKQTLQLQTSVVGKLTFRTATSRDTVLNRAVGTDIPDTIQLDDQICLVQGTCIAPLSPVRNFLIEFTVSEIIRSLGGDASSEEQVLQKFEKQIENTSAGREGTKKVQRKSGAWGRAHRRYFLTSKQ